MDNFIVRKNISLELKGEKEGSFVAAIATLNVVDKDGDRTLPGAFPDGKEVVVSAYMHTSWGGALPVGKAIIKEEGELVKAYGEFNLNTESGRETYEAVKFTGGLQEWSYGFKILDSKHETVDGEQIKDLIKLDPFEISPVLLGAGVGTATLAIKSEKTTYATQAETALAAVKDLMERTKSLADLKQAEGRTISEVNLKRISELKADLEETIQDIAAFLDVNSPVKEEAKAQLALINSRVKLLTREVI